jgi:hypothetical protein
MTPVPSPDQPIQMYASRITALAVALFLGLGGFLRVYRFSRPGLWIDEYGTWWVVAQGGWSDLVHRAVHIQGQSPFYYLIVKLTTDLLGAGPFSLRLPSIVFGIATLALAYPLGLALFRERYVALFALAAFAVSEPLIWYAQEARPYSLALFCTGLSFICYLRALERGSTAWCVAYVLATAGVFYAHYLFGFVVVVLVAHLFVVRGRSWLSSRQWPLTLLALGLLCLPAAPQLAHLFDRRAVLDWVPPVSWSVLLHLFVAFLDLPLLIVLALVTFLIGFRSGRGGQLFDRTSVSLVALWFLLPVGALGAASLLLGVNLLFDRYVLFILPAGLLVAAGVAGLGRREGWRSLVPFLTLLVFSFSWSLIPSVQRTGGFAERYDEDWTGAVASLESVARPGDVILYGTAFAEADQLRLLAPDPLILSFIRAPLTANLRPGREYTLLGLPFRVNDQTRPYVLSLMRQASAGRRVLIIGLGDAVAEVTTMLIGDGGFTPVMLTPHGLVRVIVLERKEG